VDVVGHDDPGVEHVEAADRLAVAQGAAHYAGDARILQPEGASFQTVAFFAGRPDSACVFEGQNGGGARRGGSSQAPAYEEDGLIGKPVGQLSAVEGHGSWGRGGGEKVWRPLAGQRRKSLRLQEEGVYPAAFAAIRGPALMLHGSADPHPGRMILAGLKRYMPQLEYKEWERCGHFPWQEKAVREEFFAYLREWLARGVR
jgi:pimeloyl-ACP methyl ester carboxylesterase